MNKNFRASKSLKGVDSTGSGSSDPLNSNSLKIDTITLIEELDGVYLTNATIDGGVANNLLIGANNPTTGFFTNLYSGAPTLGYEVIFYGSTINNFLKWDGQTNALTVNGSVNFSSGSNVALGNFTLSGNTMTTTNTNGPINLSPNGSGPVNINAPLTITTTSGGITASVAQAISLTSTGSSLSQQSFLDTSIQTTNGDILMGTETTLSPKTITSLFNDSSLIRVVTSTAHQLRVGDSVILSSTNSTPPVNGTHTVQSIVSATAFRISSGTLTSPGTSGSLVKTRDRRIVMDSLSLDLQREMPLRWVNGAGTVQMTGKTDATMAFTSTTGYLFENQVPVAFGTSGQTLQFDGTRFLLRSTTYPLVLDASETIIQGNVTVNGTTELSEATVFSIADPILTIGGTSAPTSDDNKDRGIEFFYYKSGQAQKGFFGWKSNVQAYAFYNGSTNTNEVVTGQLANLMVNGFIGQPDLTFTAARIFLTASTSIHVPTTIPLFFGTTASIYHANGALNMEETTGVISLSSPIAIRVPTATPLSLNGSTQTVTLRGTALNQMVLSASSDIQLTSGSQVVLPTSIPLVFGTFATRIVNSGTDLVLNATTNTFIQSPTIVAPVNGRFVFSNAISSPSLDFIQGGNPGLLLNSVGNTTVNTLGGSVAVNALESITLTSSNNDVLLSPNGAVRIPTTKSLFLGEASIVELVTTKHLRIQTGDTATRDVIIAGRRLDATGITDRMTLSSNVPVQYGATTETIKGTSGSIQVDAVTSFIVNAPTTILNGNLVVNGTQTFIDSTITQLVDPVITLSRTVPTLDDGKFRGIEFRYFDTASRLGFFGYNNTTGRWTFLKSATNTGEVLSGTKGAIDVGGLFLAGDLDMQNNRILNCNTLFATTVSPVATTLTLTGQTIALTASSSITVPTGTALTLGSCTIVGSTTDLTLSGTNLNLNGSQVTTVSNRLRLNVNQALEFGSTTMTVLSNGTDLFVASTGALRLNPTTQLIVNASSTINYGNLTMTASSLNMTGALPGGTLFWNADVTRLNRLSLNAGNTSALYLASGVTPHVTLESSTGTVIIKNNLQVNGGTISNAIYQGSVIAMAYGGTNKASYTAGSVIFATTTTLDEDNANFFYNNTTKRLGLGTASPVETITVSKNGYVGLQSTLDTDLHGLSFLNGTNGQFVWAMERSGTGLFLSSATTTTGVASKTSLTRRMIMQGSTGAIGIGVTALASLDTAHLLQINGSMRVVTAIRLGTTSTAPTFLQATGTTLTVNATTLDLAATSVITVASSIPIQLGGTTNTLVFNGTYVALSSTSNDLLLSPSQNVNVPLGKCIRFLHSVTVASSPSLCSNATTNSVTLASPIGDVILSYDPSLNKSLVLPSLGAVTWSGSTDSIKQNASGILLTSTLTQVSQNLNVQSTLQFGGSNQVFVGRQGTDDLYITNNLGDIFLTGQEIKIPANVPLQFGTSGTETIYGDNSQLYLNTSTNVRIVGDTVITGDLTVLGATNSVNSITIASSESSIFEIGPYQYLTITQAVNANGTEVVLTSTIPHNLVIGDSITITQSNSTPTLLGTYTVTQVPSAVTFRITAQVSSPGTSLTVKTKQVFNDGKDIGIQLNYHTPSLGTAGARYGFFGLKNNTNRFYLYITGSNTNTIFTGSQFGDLQLNKLFATTLSGFTLEGALIAGGQSISGSNFTIAGGTITNVAILSSSANLTSLVTSSASITGGQINNVPIGQITPSTGSFTQLSVSSSGLVVNLNAQLLGGQPLSSMLLRNGTTPLTANWNAGSFEVASLFLRSPSLIPEGIVFADLTGRLVNDTLLTYSSGLLSVPSIAFSSSTQPVDFNGQNMSNVAIVSGDIQGTDVDMTGATLTLEDGQIPLTALGPGTPSFSITGNASTVTNGVYTTDFDADHTILKADVAGAPESMIVLENSFVGRKDGAITSLTQTDALDILGINPNMAFKYTVDRVTISAPTNVGNLNLDKNLTFVTISGTSGTEATGIISNGTYDGQVKIIMISNMSAGVTYSVVFDNVNQKLIDAVGYPGAKKILFETQGQRAKLVWDHSMQAWFLLGGSASILSA